MQRRTLWRTSENSTFVETLRYYSDFCIKTKQNKTKETSVRQREIIKTYYEKQGMNVSVVPLSIFRTHLLAICIKNLFPSFIVKVIINCFCILLLNIYLLIYDFISCDPKQGCKSVNSEIPLTKKTTLNISVNCRHNIKK